jgi:hypothetical protein
MRLAVSPCYYYLSTSLYYTIAQLLHGNGLDLRHSLSSSCCGVTSMMFLLLDCTSIGRAIAAQCVSILTFSMHNSLWLDATALILPSA